MSEDPAKKIIIDEDWKSQVERERETLRGQEPPTGDAPHPPASEAPAADGDDNLPLPPPDLIYLASTFYMQALVSLGLIAHPGSGETKVHLPQARHAIDTLQMIQAKTEGNRTAEESEALEGILHEVRMAFVGVQTKAGK